MKVAGSLRALYESLVDDLEGLKSYTDEILQPFAAKRKWHYESRVKSLDSFALKAETGRFDPLDQVEDLFGAAVVVTNQGAIPEAERMLSEEVGIVIKNRRPPDPKLTTKWPSDFRFDDLRLYVNHTQPQGTRPKPHLDRVFEIQLKTFLQHAWSMATHEAVYKPDKIAWGRERVGYQTRAALEHVETSLAAIEEVEATVPFPSSRQHEALNEVVDVLDKHWDAERLPADRRRLSECIHAILRRMSLAPTDLDKHLASASGKGMGAELLDVSPYQAIVLTLFGEIPDAKDRLVAAQKPELRLLITPEMCDLLPLLEELPEEMVVEVPTR